MKKVYVVTQGSYSDYHICAIFDKRELADKFIETFDKAQRWDSFEIEEWDLNPFKLEMNKNLRPYFVRMTKEGECTEIYPADSAYGFGCDVKYGFDVRKNLYHYCMAKDKTHAIKSTNELRGMLIAENQWRD